MTDARQQRYAYAGALAVTTAELLKQVHVATRPSAPQRPAAQPRARAAAAARAHSAAAASSALVARLLILERDDARAADPTIAPPELTELAVTVLEGVDRTAWRGTLRAATAAGAEIEAARVVWEQWRDPAATGILTSLDALLRYVEQLATLLVHDEPAPPDAGERNPIERARRGNAH